MKNAKMQGIEIMALAWIVVAFAVWLMQFADIAPSVIGLFQQLITK